MRNGKLLFFVLVSWLLIVLPARICPGKEEIKTFVAYSMKVAQARVEQAVKASEDFRKRQPDLYYLGGITKPWAVVLDTRGGDWILVGERDPKCSVLTLDDWVVALRARFIHAERDPGVTIDPRPCDECVKAGKKEACRHYTRQDVRFFGGIEKTHFGQVCYEADWLMKKIGLGLEKLPVEKVRSYYDLSVEQHRSAGYGTSRVSSRFWFYPIVNRVNVLGDVVLLEQFQMGVFTELLYAEVDGNPVTDVDSFEDLPSEGFSRSFSDNYDAAAEAREVLETLRGLTRLAALAKGVTQVNAKRPMEFWLRGFRIQKEDIPEDVAVLSVRNTEAGFEISGGVQLMALATRLQGGDARALKDLLLKSRRGADALSWGFQMETRNGQLVGVEIPTDLADPSRIGQLFQHALFLQQRKRFEAAIESYSQITKLDPNLSYAYNNRGVAYSDKGEQDNAIEEYDRAIKLNPDFAEAYCNRGNAHSMKKEFEVAIADFSKAIELNPELASAYNGRGVTCCKLAKYETAIEDFSMAIILDPTDAIPCANRGIAYSNMWRHDEAMADCSKAVSLNPGCAAAYLARGTVYLDLADYDKSVQDLNLAAAIDPQNVDAYVNRGRAYLGRSDHFMALADFQKALEVDLTCADAYIGLGDVYAGLGYPVAAVACYNRATQTSDPALAYVKLALLYYEFGQWELSGLELQKAVKADPGDIRVVREVIRLSFLETWFGLAASRNITEPSELSRRYREKIDSGVHYCDEVLHEHAGFGLAYLLRATLYLDKGMQAEALEDCNRALSLTTGPPIPLSAAHAIRGRVLFEMRQYDGARSDFYKAIELEPFSLSGYAARNWLARLRNAYPRGR